VPALEDSVSDGLLVRLTTWRRSIP